MTKRPPAQTQAASVARCLLDDQGATPWTKPPACRSGMSRPEPALDGRVACRCPIEWAGEARRHRGLAEIRARVWSWRREPCGADGPCADMLPPRETPSSTQSTQGQRPRSDRSMTGSSPLRPNSAVTSSWRPSKTYVALPRSKQFGTVGPASRGRLEIGLNLKGLTPAGRLETSSGICIHRVRLATPADLDDEVVGRLRNAYERA